MATGVRAMIIREMMARVESTRPPGVRSVKTTSAAWASSARLIVSIMYWAETGWMMLSTTAEYTTGEAVDATQPTGGTYVASANANTRPAKNRTVRILMEASAACGDYRLAPRKPSIVVRRRR